MPPPCCTDAPYAFSQLNVAVADLPSYTDDEYAKLIAPRSGDWSREDTDHLMELVKQFDRRFIIVHDRYAQAASVAEPCAVGPRRVML